MPISSLSPKSPLAFCFFFALFCLAFSSCSVGDFVGAYFNTYYNAQKAFGEAEDEVWKQPDLKQDGAAKNYLVQFNVPQTAKTKFASVIEKCSKLLEYHPDSKLVDDALMMIGKSYFYQSDYQRAERKFKELETGYPESELLPEARMLMAYSFYKEGDKPSAARTATELLAAAQADEDEYIIAYVSLLLAQMDLEDKNHALSLEHFREAAENAETGEQKSFALLHVGEMYDTTGDYVKAEEAFREAASRSPNYLGEYRGQIGAARMLAKQEKFDASLELLEELRTNLNYKEFFGEIELQTANIYRDQGNLESAVDQYRYVDTAYARTEWSASSYYQLGLLYETRLALYDSARAAYNKGKTEAGQFAVAPLLARRAEYMNKYATFGSEVRQMDSLRTYWLTPHDTTHIDTTRGDTTRNDTARSDTIRSDTAQSDAIRNDTTRSDSSQNDRTGITADIVAADTAAVRGVALADSGKPKAPSRPPLPLDTVLTRMASAQSELATLFYTGIGRPDSALYWYDRLVREQPKSPLVPRALFSIAQIYSADSTISRQAVDSLYRRLVNEYPESEFAAEARRLLGLPAVVVIPDSAETLYRRAETALLAGRNDHALDTLRILERMFPSSEFAPRAKFAAGWLYEQVLNRPDSAIANYQGLRARYPKSPYTARVEPKLIEVEMKSRAAADSVAALKKADSTRAAAKSDSSGIPPAVRSSGAPASSDSVGVPGRADSSAVPGRAPSPKSLRKRTGIDDDEAPAQQKMRESRSVSDTTEVRDSTAIPENPPDITVPPDTTVLPPDTTVLPPDNTALPPDITVPPDTTVLPPDTTALPPDSVPNSNQERQREE